MPDEVASPPVARLAGLEIDDLVVRALSNRQIAAELVLSERTVESHVRSILGKLNLANRAELIARRR